MKTVNHHIIFYCAFIFCLLSCKENKKQLQATVVNEPPALTIDLLDLKSQNKLGKETLVTVVNDPVYHKTKRYYAYDAAALLKKEIDLSKVDSKNTLIVFECIDGYKPEMSLAQFLKAKPYLAFRDVDAPKGTNWEKIIKNGNKMNADPFYVVYQSVPANDHEDKWPYNVIKFHFVAKDKNNSGIQPKDNEQAATGFALFEKYCITCHAINGTGGTMGPELNDPKSVTEYWKENELVNYIVNPSLFRNKVKMPTLGLTKQQSQEIVVYLKYMAGRKNQ